MSYIVKYPLFSRRTLENYVSFLRFVLLDINILSLLLDFKNRLYYTVTYLSFEKVGDIAQGRTFDAVLLFSGGGECKWFCPDFTLPIKR